VKGANAERVPAEAAEAAVGRLREMSADLRGCALLGPGDEVLAATGDAERWSAAAADLLAAADEAGDEPASHVHVATEDGEAFAVRESGLAMVAVSERFTLSSLMIFDMRAVLRGLAREEG
jgi:rRNA maturation endonuclease Nob1